MPADLIARLRVPLPDSIAAARDKYRHRQVQSLSFNGTELIFEVNDDGGRRRPPDCAESMSLNFPNESRSFDGTRRAVRFWGHDSAMEATFFVTESALKTVQPDMRLDEAGMLGAFDANRNRIYAAAAKVYARGRRGSYDLERSDF